MNQIVTVAKIVGEGAKVLTRAFERWSEACVQCRKETSLVEPGQWPSECRDEMAELANHIQTNAS